MSSQVTRPQTPHEERWHEVVRQFSDKPRPFQEHWQAFREIFAGRPPSDGPPVVWRPTAEGIAASNLGRWMEELGFGSYPELHAWSASERAEFWQRAVRRLGIVFSRSPDAILDVERGVEDALWLPGAEMSCTDSCFQAPADQPAVIEGREGISEPTVTPYGELERLVNRFAGGLLGQGLEPGDRVALYMPMNLECVVAYLGTIRAGCAVVSIADSFSAEEVARRLQLGGASAVVTVDRYVRGGKPVALYERLQEAGAPRTVVIPGREEAAPKLRPGDLHWGDLLSPDASFDSSVGDPYRVTNVLFSSGTTAAPKAIPWTHLTPIKGAMDGWFHHDIRPGDVVAWPTNIGWMMGPWLIYASLMNRAAMALYEGAPTGEGFARFVVDAGVTMLGVVPSLVRAWRAGGHVNQGEWSRIRVFSSTGEPSSQEDYLWLMSRAAYRAPVIEYLGGTEIGGGHITGTVVQPASPATFTTPALGIDFVILDDDGRPVAEREAGELFLIPPSIGLSQSLLNADHHQVYYADCPPGPGGEVLRRHGDRMARLPGGFYKAQGRADDAMNLGGIKVSSVELETVLGTHEGVYETAAVGVQPEGEGAEKLVVFVVPAGDVSADDLRGELGFLLARRLNPLFKIHDLVLTDELPRTASNKLMRRTLRSRYLEGLGRRG